MTPSDLFWLGVLGLIIYQIERMTKAQIWEDVKAFLLLALVAGILCAVGYWICLI